MPRLSSADQRQVRALEAQLGTWSEADPPALAAIVPELQRLLRAEKALAYLMELQPSGVRLRFVHAAGDSARRMRQVAEQWLRGRSAAGTLYDLTAPERAQRNVVLGLDQLPWQKPSLPIRDELYPRLGLDRRDQLRALVCDGPSLLAWVGAFRPEPFSVRDRQLLHRLVPALQRRLALERRLGRAQLHAGALAAALEALGTAAFLVDGAGAIQDMNASARALCERDAHGVRADLAHSLAHPAAARRFALTPIRARGLPDHYLAVERGVAADGAPKVSAAARRWGLTPRQTEVLYLVARGEANKTIADALGCTESTVEQHVTALFAKADVGSRAALVARLWSAF